MNIKQELKTAATAAIKCPSCGEAAGRRCRNTVANNRGVHVFVKTHQRRLSAFIASSNVKWTAPQSLKQEGK